MDLKYDILKHPNIKGTADGGKVPFIHGKTKEAIASVKLRYTGEIGSIREEGTRGALGDYEILTNEELEAGEKADEETEEYENE